MGIGEKIKEYRIKAGLTQKDLADKLFVTYQAVSKWENDETEPSFEILKEMCKILNCTTDDLFGIEKQEEEKMEEAPKVEKVVVEAPKPVLAVCEKCNKPIYDSNDIARFEETIVHRHGRSSSRETIKRLYCKECNKKRLAAIEQEEIRKRKIKMKKMKVVRIHSFIWPSLLLIAGIILGILKGWFWYVIGALGFTFLSCVILNNNFIFEMWISISTWSIKLPGVIFTLDLEGIFFLIAVKILGALLSLAVTIFCVIFATTLGFVLSIFVYPFALIKNIKGIE